MEKVSVCHGSSVTTDGAFDHCDVCGKECETREAQAPAEGSQEAAPEEAAPATEEAATEGSADEGATAVEGTAEAGEENVDGDAAAASETE